MSPASSSACCSVAGTSATTWRDQRSPTTPETTPTPASSRAAMSRSPAVRERGLRPAAAPSSASTMLRRPRTTVRVPPLQICGSSRKPWAAPSPETTQPAPGSPVEGEVLGVDELAAVEVPQPVREPQPRRPAVVGGDRGARVGQRLTPGGQGHLGQVVEQHLLPGAERLARGVDGGEEGRTVAGEDRAGAALQEGVHGRDAGCGQRPGDRCRAGGGPRLGVVHRDVADRGGEVDHQRQADRARERDRHGRAWVQLPLGRHARDPSPRCCAARGRPRRDGPGPRGRTEHAVSTGEHPR